MIKKPIRLLIPPTSLRSSEKSRSSLGNFPKLVYSFSSSYFELQKLTFTGHLESHLLGFPCLQKVQHAYTFPVPSSERTSGVAPPFRWPTSAPPPTLGSGPRIAERTIEALFYSLHSVVLFQSGKHSYGNQHAQPSHPTSLKVPCLRGRYLARTLNYFNLPSNYQPICAPLKGLSFLLFIF